LVLSILEPLMKLPDISLGALLILLVSDAAYNASGVFK
jgi:hypothetical protein